MKNMSTLYIVRLVDNFRGISYKDPDLQKKRLEIVQEIINYPVPLAYLNLVKFATYLGAAHLAALERLLEREAKKLHPQDNSLVDWVNHAIENNVERCAILQSADNVVLGVYLEFSDHRESMGLKVVENGKLVIWEDGDSVPYWHKDSPDEEVIHPIYRSRWLEPEELLRVVS